MARSALGTAILTLAVGCGARSGLLDPDPNGHRPAEEVSGPDGGRARPSEAGRVDAASEEPGSNDAGAETDARGPGPGGEGERPIPAECRSEATSCQSSPAFDDECVVGGCDAACYQGCSHGCVGGGCDYFCQSSLPCQLGCDGGDCSFECRGGGECELACAGGGCELECSGHSDIPCDMDCCGGDCTAYCARGRTCRMDCAAGGCDLECGRDSTCEVSCCGGGCTVECDRCQVVLDGSSVPIHCSDGASPETCPDGSLTCGRC